MKRDTALSKDFANFSHADKLVNNAYNFNENI